MFVHKVKINFFDCDPAGILFYGRIYEVCHSAYEAMIGSFLLNEDYWNNREYVVPIITSSAKYRTPIKYGDALTIELLVTVLKNSSFELEYTCKNQEGTVCAEVKTVHVFVDGSTWKKTEITSDIREGLEKYFIVS